MIDFSFIAQLEGNKLHGYVPQPKHSNSGVTIASGFDIGQRGAIEITTAFAPALANKLLPYTGKIKYAAQHYLQNHPLKITADEATIINTYSHKTAEQRLRRQWQQSHADTGFEHLPDACQTVIASVAFQYGNLATRTPNFWSQVTSGDWQAAIANLRNFGDIYASRRHLEADLLCRAEMKGTSIADV